jgi:3',5'-cyclic AMP phosphodiesterase CpdA
METRILHISDLHVTSPDGLMERWSGAREAARWAGMDRYDFIVISGDLSHAATDAEYKEVAAFLNELVETHLKTHDRWRVVVVPGNHDVDWAWCRAHRHNVNRARLRNRKQYREFLEHPEHAMLRVRMNQATARLEAVEFRRSNYNQRFASFQRFVDGFYSDPPEGSPHRVFRSTGEDAEQWSAHVFPEDGLAFYGFSSCHGNDTHWTGAAICAKAISAAEQHAVRYAPGLTRVAVWHHGLASSRGAPDFLPVGEVAQLKQNGFRLGFHGHTHEDEFRRMDDAFTSAFPILAVGSFGASDRDLPGGVQNQFGVTCMFSRRYVLQRVFSFHNEWREETVRYFDLDATPHPNPRHSPVMDRNARRVRIDSEGVAHHEVELTGLTIDGEMRLAAVHTYPSRRLEAEDVTTVPSLTLSARDLGRERRTFYLLGRASRETVRWSYRCTNSYIAFPQDLRFREGPDLAALNLAADEDGFCHEVAALSRELVLGLQLQNPVARRLARDWRVRIEHPEQERWVSCADENAEGMRLTALAKKDASGIEVVIANPLVGHRYSLLYRFADEVDEDLERVLGALQEVLTRARFGVLDEEPPRILTAALEPVVRGAADDRGGGTLLWVGSLWEEARRRLVTCFGRFPNATWGACFAHGEGIVGHSFRTRAPVLHARGNETPLYAKPADLPRGDEHSWVVSVPLLLRPGGPAVGTISFADFGLGRDLSAASRWLAALASAKPLPRGEPLRKLSDALSRRFWECAADLVSGDNRTILADAARHWVPLDAPGVCRARG